MQSIARLSKATAWFFLSAASLLWPLRVQSQQWSGFIATELTGAYVSLTRNNGALELWREARAIEAIPWRRLVLERGPSLTQLGERVTVFSAELIHDVSSNLRQFSRSTVNFHPGAGYTALVSVTQDYQPGKNPLIPALFFSVSGQASTWRYLGKLRGEPSQLTAQQYIWSDGGAVFQLPDGRWRIYLNGYGHNLAALESTELEGQWRFLRDKQGAIRELAKDLQGRNPRGDAYGFPSIVRLSSGHWHAWLSDRWPPESIWHLSSDDGLNWQLFSEQAEITRADSNGQRFKNLRVGFAKDGKTLIGLLSVWDSLPDQPDRQGWRLHKAEWLGLRDEK